MKPASNRGQPSSRGPKRLGRVIGALGDAAGRLEKRLLGFGLWALVGGGMGLYLFAVGLAGLAVFHEYLPDWLMEDIRTYLFAGNRNIEFSLSLLAQWGLIDILKNTVIGAGVFAVALVGLLILANLMIVWAKRRRRRLAEERVKEQQRPRIRLKNPVIVTLDDGEGRRKHRYTAHITLVVARASDLDAVLETMAGLRPFLTSAAEGVIRAAYMRIDPEIMAAALTRAAAEATGGSVDKVELIDMTHLEIDRQTGEFVAGKGSPGRGFARPMSPAAPPRSTDPVARPIAAASSNSGAGDRREAAAAPGASQHPRTPALKPEFEPGAALAQVLPNESAPDSATTGAARPASPAESAQDPKASLDLSKIRQVMSGLRPG